MEFMATGNRVYLHGNRDTYSALQTYVIDFHYIIHVSDLRRFVEPTEYWQNVRD